MTATMTNDQMAASYYRAALMRQRPEYVPARIKLDRELFGSGPFRGKGVPAGEHECQCNQWGAISVVDRGGLLLGVKPDECDVLGWRRNEVGV